MRRTRISFSWIAVVLACCGSWFILPGSVNSVRGQTWPGYETSPVLPVPRSWVTHWYARTEYMSLWAKGNPLPALVTTSPQGTPQADAGVLGEPGTEILFGDERIATGGMQGARITFGHWLDECKSTALEAQYWVAGISQDGGSLASEAGDPIIARPFFNTENGGEDAQLVAYPGLAGSLRIDSRNEMHSVNLLLRKEWLQGIAGGSVDLFGGYRYFRFRESLAIEESVAGTFGLYDKFTAENDFHGVDFGAEFEMRHGPWLFDVTTKVAVGDMREKLTVSGLTYLLADPGTTTPGGWLTAPSNLGRYGDHELVAIPELDLRLVFAAYERIRLSVGYNMAFVSKVVRTGDQIDTTVNPGQLTALPLARGGGVASPDARPAPNLDDTALWLYGITFGVEMRW